MKIFYVDEDNTLSKYFKLFGAYKIHFQWTPDDYIYDFKVNDDVTKQEQRYSKIRVDSYGNFFFALDDDRNFTNNSWHRVFDK